MTNDVYICSTLYHVFLSTLKSTSKKHEAKESLLIVCDHTPGMEPVAQKLVDEGFFSHYIFVPFFKINDQFRSEVGVFNKYFRRKKYIIDYVENNSEIKNWYDFIKNSEINIFNEGLTYTFFLVRFKDNPFNQMEDGLYNYNPYISNFKAFKRKYILRTPQGEGMDDQIKSIEVQYPEKLPERVRHKGVKLDISGNDILLDTKNWKKIQTIFSQNHSFNFDNHKKVIIITQPFSEDGFVTEEYKINLYRQIIKEYTTGYNVYIKVHPRETTDYTGLLGLNITEIPRNFPLEILNFYPDIFFEKGITIFSSALDNLTNIKERIFLGLDYDQKLHTKKRLF